MIYECVRPGPKTRRLHLSLARETTLCRLEKSGARPLHPYKSHGCMLGPGTVSEIKKEARRVGAKVCSNCLGVLARSHANQHPIDRIEAGI